MAAWNNGAPTFTTVAKAAYDVHGRVTAGWDAMNAKTTTAYTPATGGPVTATTVTNPLQHDTTTTLRPGLGRRHLHRRPQRQAHRPDLRRARPAHRGLATRPGQGHPDRHRHLRLPGTHRRHHRRHHIQAERRRGATSPRYTHYDGLLRARQTQAPSPSGGRLITDTFYDSAGRQTRTYDTYHATGSPDAPWSGHRGGVRTHPDPHRLRRRGPHHRVDLPALRRGAMAHHHLLRRRPHRRHPASRRHRHLHRHRRPRPHHRAAPVPRPRPDPSHGGQLGPDQLHLQPQGPTAEASTDPAGNEWVYGYDIRGRQTSVDDPDNGPTTQRLRQRRPAHLHHRRPRHQARLHLRPAQPQDAPSTRTRSAATPRAQWVYDTVAKGQLTQSTRLRGQRPSTGSASLGYNDTYQPTGVQYQHPGHRDRARRDLQLRLHLQPGRLAWPRPACPPPTATCPPKPSSTTTTTSATPPPEHRLRRHDQVLRRRTPSTTPSANSTRSPATPTTGRRPGLAGVHPRTGDRPAHRHSHRPRHRHPEHRRRPALHLRPRRQHHQDRRHRTDPGRRHPVLRLRPPAPAHQRLDPDLRRLRRRAAPPPGSAARRPTGTPGPSTRSATGTSQTIHTAPAATPPPTYTTRHRRRPARTPSADHHRPARHQDLHLRRHRQHHLPTRPAPPHTAHRHRQPDPDLGRRGPPRPPPPTPPAPPATSTTPTATGSSAATPPAPPSTCPARKSATPPPPAPATGTRYYTHAGKPSPPAPPPASPGSPPTTRAPRRSPSTPPPRPPPPPADPLRRPARHQPHLAQRQGLRRRHQRPHRPDPPRRPRIRPRHRPVHLRRPHHGPGRPAADGTATPTPTTTPSPTPTPAA